MSRQESRFRLADGKDPLPARLPGFPHQSAQRTFPMARLRSSANWKNSTSLRLATPAWSAVLALFLGTAQAAMLPPGTTPCPANGSPTNYGSFLVLKSTTFIQTPTTSPTEITAPSSLAILRMTSPADFLFSNVVATASGGFRATLLPSGIPGVSQWSEVFATAAALETGVPSSPWNVSFRAIDASGEQFVGFFPFPLSPGNPPTPDISNLAAAQDIPAASPFTLQWTPWIGSRTNDRIALTLTDAAGQIVFSADNEGCASQRLPAGATSAEVPAQTLAPGQTYSGTLVFGAELFADTDDGALLVQRALQSRATQFTLRTAGSSGTAAELNGPRIVGTNLVFTLVGSPGSRHAIESTANFVTWNLELEVTLPASGTAEFTLPIPSGESRLFRARSLGGGPVLAEPAHLTLSPAGPGLLDLLIKGTPGATYRIDASTNLVHWSELQSVTLPPAQSNAVVQLPLNATTPFLSYRAVAVGGGTSPDPTPTLAIVAEGNSVRLTLADGGPQRTYLLQRTADPGGTWTDTTSELVTDASGSATLLLPRSTQPAEFFRTLMR